jgi:hypothetical protein
MNIKTTEEGIILSEGMMTIELDRRIYKLEAGNTDPLLKELWALRTLAYESDTKTVYVYKSPSQDDWRSLHPFVRRGMIGKCYQRGALNVQKCTGNGWVCAVDKEISVSPRCVLDLFYKSPSAADQLKTLSAAFVKAVNTKTLTTHVKPETFAFRKSICQSCEYFDPTAFLGTGRCRVCGCGEAKLRMPSQSCPKEKWGTE